MSTTIGSLPEEGEDKRAVAAADYLAVTGGELGGNGIRSV